MSHDPHDPHDLRAFRLLSFPFIFQHVCADTLRSVAVLVAAGLGTLFSDFVTPSQVDSAASVLVSIIILTSLGPLVQGLYFTACKIREIWLGHDRHQHNLHHDDNHNQNYGSNADAVIDV